MNKKILGLSLLIILIIILLISLQNKKITNLSMTSIAGKKINIQELKGKVILINFWATDCPGCINEMPALINTYNKYKKNNFEVIAVSMFYDPPSRVISYTEKNNLPFPVVVDFDKKIMSSFGGVKLTPTSILIDKKGKIINTIIGEINFLKFTKLLEHQLKLPI